MDKQTITIDELLESLNACVCGDDCEKQRGRQVMKFVDVFGIVHEMESSMKPITNADRIRAMTDDELADWVWSAETAGRAYGPRGKKAWLDWLKEEAEE